MRNRLFKIALENEQRTDEVVTDPHSDLMDENLNDIQRATESMSALEGLREIASKIGNPTPVERSLMRLSAYAISIGSDTSPKKMALATESNQEIAMEGFFSAIGDFIMRIINGIKNFFKNLFSSEEATTDACSSNKEKSDKIAKDNPKIGPVSMELTASNDPNDLKEHKIDRANLNPLSALLYAEEAKKEEMNINTIVKKVERYISLNAEIINHYKKLVEEGKKALHTPETIKASIENGFLKNFKEVKCFNTEKTEELPGGKEISSDEENSFMELRSNLKFTLPTKCIVVVSNFNAFKEVNAKIANSILKMNDIYQETNSFFEKEVEPVLNAIVAYHKKVHTSTNSNGTSVDDNSEASKHITKFTKYLTDGVNNRTKLISAMKFFINAWLDVAKSIFSSYHRTNVFNDSTI